MSTTIVNGKPRSSRFLVVLIATGTSTLKVVGILVALKATVDRNVNPTVDKILVALKAIVTD